MSKSKGFSQVLFGVQACMLLSAFSVCAPVQAVDAVYQQAMTDFQARKYAAALAGFKKVASTNRSDIQSHYYLALCYQNTNQFGLAAREYQWVATYSPDPSLKLKAQAGYAQLTRSSGSSTSSASASQPAWAKTAAGMGIPGLAQQRKSEFSNGRLRITEFYTQWCHVCKEFDPEFKQAESNYRSKCDFQRLDAEEPGNRNLVEKYQVRNYPTTVMADSNGKPVKIFVGSTSSYGLGMMIDAALAQLPK